MPGKAILRAQRSTEVTATARNTGQATRSRASRSCDQSVSQITRYWSLIINASYDSSYKAFALTSQIVVLGRTQSFACVCRTST
eukprot:1820143-Pleurochrysis_carterae.AAC.3